MYLVDTGYAVCCWRLCTCASDDVDLSTSREKNIFVRLGQFLYFAQGAAWVVD